MFLWKKMLVERGFYTFWSKNIFINILMERFLEPLNSPEPKSQVSFSDHNMSVGRSRRVVVNISHFLLFLKNHISNFKQTWHKACLGEGHSNLVTWRASPLAKGRYQQNSEITLTNFKNLLLQNHLANVNQPRHKASFSALDILNSWHVYPYLY